MKSTTTPYNTTHTHAQSFTLIELLVVIVIIGILSGLVVIATSSFIEKANLAKAQAFSSTVQNELLFNLVSEWTFDELTPDGKTKDTWGNNHGTVVGAEWVDDCVHGKCYSFDGVDDYIDCGNDKSLGIKDKLTLSAWVKIENLTSGDGTKRIIDKATGANGLGGYALAHRANNGGELFLAINGEYQSVSMKQEDEWIYLTSIVDGANWKIYLNGKIILSDLKKKDLIATEASLRLGQANTFTARHEGKIDDVRIYNSALSTSQIKQNYIAGLNSLLAKGTLLKDEYNERLEALATN